MRKIDKVILHCTATKPGQNVNVDIIRSWHRKRGFRDIGYHFLILEDGTLQRGRSIYETGAHTKGHNKDSVGVAYCGGIDQNGNPKDTMTDAQIDTFRGLYAALDIVFVGLRLHGHNEYAAKACPSFKVKDKFPDLCQIG